MSLDADFNFLEQKIRLLKAADRFAEDLESAKIKFNYEQAIQTLGNTAVGMQYFYGRASNLLTYVNGHKFFKYASALLAEQKQKHLEVQGSANNLSISFSELQSAATDLDGLVAENLIRLKDMTTDPDLKIVLRKALSDLSQGSEILHTIINTKPERYWIDLYEEGFKKPVD